jgi:PIN domain nuclease of toxin-antitoxin system
MEAWARKLIANLDNEILVSAASVYEISLKVRHGKLPEAVVFESDLITNIESRLGYTLLPLEPESMTRAARFDDSHADPFHRMIAAQAIQNNLPGSQHRSKARCLWRSAAKETEAVAE